MGACDTCDDVRTSSTQKVGEPCALTKEGQKCPGKLKSATEFQKRWKKRSLRQAKRTKPMHSPETKALTCDTCGDVRTNSYFLENTNIEDPCGGQVGLDGKPTVRSTGLKCPGKWRSATPEEYRKYKSQLPLPPSPTE